MTSNRGRLQNKRMPSPPTDESSLCLSCGLCCSGAIFGRVPVEQDDDVAWLDAAGVALSVNCGEREFKLPCPAHDGRQCQVYASRPAACRDYRCDLLRRVTGGEIAHVEALGIIGEAVRLNRNLLQAIRDVAPGDSSRMPRARLLRHFSERLESASEPEARRRIANIVVQILGLDGYLRRNFGDSVLKWTEPGVGPGPRPARGSA
ncbi:MAG TPA: YkgJ family cysteine cluster protein [Reyranella sp.]